MPPAPERTGKAATVGRGAARRAARRAKQGRARWWPVALVAALAVLAVGGLIWLGQGTSVRPTVSVAEAGKVRGDPAAPVQIDDWGDFQCPACRAYVADTERQLLSTIVAQGKAKIVWHNYAFIGPESFLAAEAADCAADQGKFWEYHDKLYAEQGGENSGAFSKQNLKRFGAEIGLDASTFNPCVDAERYADQVRAETESGRQLGVNATPTMFVNGRKLEGVPSFAQISQIVAAAAPASGSARPTGTP